MTRARVLQLIQDAFESLRSSELLAEQVVARDDTVLLGSSSPLDSIAFVTFIVEIEDRIHAELGGSETFSLAINEIHTFNPDQSMLTVGVLADFILHATGSADIAGG